MKIRKMLGDFFEIMLSVRNCEGCREKKKILWCQVNKEILSLMVAFLQFYVLFIFMIIKIIVIKHCKDAMKCQNIIFIN